MQHAHQLNFLNIAYFEYKFIEILRNTLKAANALLLSQMLWCNALLRLTQVRPGRRKKKRGWECNCYLQIDIADDEWDFGLLSSRFSPSITLV